MSAGAAQPLAFELSPPVPQGAATLDAATALSRREATLRSAATPCLAGIALLLAIELPSLWGQGRQLGLAMAAMMLSIAVTLALAATPAHASRQLWRVAAATDLLVLAGWAVPRAASLPDTSSSLGAWASMPGAACATLAAVGLVLAAVAMRPTARGLATAAALLLAIGPGAGALLVAVEPGPPGGEAAITADVHVHQHLTTGETDILFRPGPKGNHYVTPITTPPNAPAVGVALVVAFAFTFVAGAIAHLRRQSTPPGRPV